MKRLIGSLVLASAVLALPLLQAQVTPPQQQQTATAPDTGTDEAAKAIFFGKRFFDLKDYASAYEQFAKADSLQPDQPPVLYDMAVVLAKAGRWSEAQRKVDRYLQLYPAGAERPLVAKLQLELEFQRELQKKRQADQDYADLFSRGRFLYAKNDLDGALKLFQQAEQQQPNDPAAVFDEGVVYEKLGDISKATERFHRYAEL
jgi:Flp pilus assembly protein TadD